MNDLRILEIPQVIFQPLEQPQIFPSIVNDNTFPIPSAKYYYVNSKGDKIPVPNTIGNESERLLSLQIWYSMKSNDVFPLLTSYVKSRDDQIGVDENSRSESQIALSMKSQIRQFPDKGDWFYYPRFDLLIDQIKGLTTEEFINDFYKFPLNPSADAFMVARLLEDFLRTDDESKLRRYLEDRDVDYLVDHSFNFYPLYYLFFLLTRFASYPFSQFQIQLSKRRFKTERNSPERIFIDSIIHYEIDNISQILKLIDKIAISGSSSAGEIFGTRDPDWVRWGNEYLINLNKEPQIIENLANVNYITAEKLYTWNDIYIEELCKRLEITMPFRSEFPTRYSFVQDISTKIQRFKADPVDNIL